MSTIPLLAQDILTSIKIAIAEYESRNDNKSPAKLLLSKDAYLEVSSLGGFVRGYRQLNETIFGVPFEISAKNGIHVHLCEPEIPIIRLSAYNTTVTEADDAEE